MRQVYTATVFRLPSPVRDERAELDDLVRIVDEDGEDYLYHVNHFVFIELPEEVERVLIAAA